MADPEGGGASLAALEELYRTQYSRFLRVALANVGSRELAADVVQEAFVRALRSRDSFDGRGTLESWVWRIVTNVALTASRSAAAARALELADVRDATNGTVATL